MKVQKSFGRMRTVKERSKPWDELNGGVLVKKDRNPFSLLEEGESEEWVSDEEMAQDPAEERENPLQPNRTAGIEGASAVVAPESIPLPITDGVDEDEIL